jgi:fluoride exporter
MAYLWVFIGSALGGMARYWCSGMAARLLGPTFPWGTLIVNVVGSMLIGALAAFGMSKGWLLAQPDAGLFAMVGICGGYTTISSFSLQTLNLALEGEWVRASLNVVGSVALCLTATGIGNLLALRIAT